MNFGSYEPYGLLTEQLFGAGVGLVGDLGLCTYPLGNGFYSYRRTTHLGEADYGREISAIVRVAAPSPDR